MGQYNSAIPTNAGLAMVAQSISGGQAVTFTKLRTSSYQYPSGTDYASLTTLMNIKQAVDITYASTADTKTVKVNATVTNAGISTAYTIQNLGIYAQIGNGTETLFAVIPAIVGDTVPVYSDTTRVSYIFAITIAVGTATGLTVNVTTAGMASVIDLQDTENDIYENLTPTIASSQVVENASGIIATFDDGADGAPMRSIEVTITPEQDLHGQSSPYPPGGGTNVLPTYTENVTSKGIRMTVNIDGSVTLNGTSTGTATLYAPESTFMWDGTSPYWLSGCPSGGNYESGYSLRVDGNNYWSKVDTGDGCALAAYNDGDSLTNVPLKFCIVVRSGTVCNNITFKPMLNAGTSGSTFAPYSNICPISGRQSVGVTRAGKNLFDTANGKNLYLKSDNSLGVGGTLLVFSVPIGTQITLSGTNGNRSALGFSTKKVEEIVSGATLDGRLSDGVLPRTFTAEYPTYVYYANTDFSQNIVDHFMIEVGSSATSYEAPNIQQITIPLGQTVYGGTVDAVSGVMTVDRAMVDLGTLTWTYSEVYYNFIGDLSGAKRPATVTDIPNILCSQYAAANGIDANNTSKNNIVALSALYERVIVRDSRYTNAASFKTAMSGVQLCYELAQPVTVQLDPKLLRSLYGINNVWSDADSVDVDYVADLKTYIAKVIAAALA